MSDILGSQMCIRRDNTIKFGVNVLTHVTFLFIILTCLFVFYTSKIVEDSVNEQVIDLLNDKVDETKQKSKTFLNNILSNNPDFNSLLRFDFSKIKKIFALENTERNNNNNLVKTILLVIIISFIVMIILSVLITKGLCSNLSIKEIILENVIIFILVGIVEITFFLNIILKYIIAYPSTLAKTALSALKES
jgi:hypothetical protein